MTLTRATIVLALLASGILAFPAPGFGRRQRPTRRLTALQRRMVLAASGVGSAGALLSLPPGLCLAAAIGAAALVRLAAQRRTGLDVPGKRHLAGVLDLVATCLDAGLTVSSAITAVLSATAEAGTDDDRGSAEPRPWPRRPGQGEVGPRRVWARRPAATSPPALEHRSALAQVAALLALGADPNSAWRPAGQVRELSGMAAAARRSALGGVRLADAVRESAADLRRECRGAGERSAARAGVAMTAPLALCFLPAFVCLGLAPVVIGMVSSLHIW